MDWGKLTHCMKSKQVMCNARSTPFFQIEISGSTDDFQQKQIAKNKKAFSW